jgi:hypothetical protein
LVEHVCFFLILRSTLSDLAQDEWNMWTNDWNPRAATLPISSSIWLQIWRMTHYIIAGFQMRHQNFAGWWFLSHL